MKQKSSTGLLGQIQIEVEMVENTLSRLKGLIEEMGNTRETAEEDDAELDVPQEATDGTGPSGVTLFTPRPSMGPSDRKYSKRLPWGYLVGYSNKIGLHENIIIDILQMKQTRREFSRKNLNAIMRKYTAGPLSYLNALSYAYAKALLAMGSIDRMGKARYRFRLV